MTYDQAMSYFRAKNPNITPGNNAFDDAFNAWSGSFGPGGYEGAAVPVDFGPVTTAGGLFGGDTATNSLTGAAQNTLTNAATTAGINPNSTQVLGSNQTGSTTSTGSTVGSGTSTESGVSSGRTTTGQTGLQSTSGGQTGSTSGVTTGSTTGTTVGGTTGRTGTTGTTTGTKGVVDTLGFGNLLRGQAAGATESTNIQQNFLRDLVMNGPKNQQALTDAAVNRSLSGPGMVGTGDMSRARAAGSAASQVGLNSMNQQLQAAGQLAGPTALTTLAAAGNPYLGETTTGTTTGDQTTSGTSIGSTTGTSSGTTAGTTAGTNYGNTLSDIKGFTDTLNLNDITKSSNTRTDETGAGTSSGSGLTVGSGNIPETKTGSSGGCYATTAYVDMGWSAKRIIRAAAKWKLSRPEYRRSLAGYSIYGPTLARFILRSPLFAYIFFPVARAVLYEELRLAKKVKRVSLGASLCHTAFHYGSLAVAVLTGRREVKQCDAQTVNLLSRNNLLMEVSQ